MRRPGRQRDSRGLIEKIRARIPGVSLRTSLIVGFPGETEQDFANLEQFIKDVQFDRLGVFAYSKEQDTPASRLPDQVPDDVKEYRVSKLMELQREIAGKRNGLRVGQEIDVLIERYDGRNDVYVGRSQYDAPEIDGEVFVSKCNSGIGEIARVRVTHSFEFDLSGELFHEFGQPDYRSEDLSGPYHHVLSAGKAETPVIHFHDFVITYNQIIAAIIFIIAASTDSLDGYIARKQKLVTNLGKLLDPLADKLLVSAVLISLVEMGKLDAWIAIVIISREFAVTGLRQIAVTEGVVIAASQWGKWKTAAQITAIIAHLINNFPFVFFIGFRFDLFASWIAAIITIYSGIDYFIKSKQLLNQQT